MRLKSIITYLLLCLISVVDIMAQSSTLFSRHYTVQDGIASNAVNTIIQDSQGYLWLGTNLGLTRFDGYRFVNFYREVDGNRRMENVTGIVEDTLQRRLLVCGSAYKVYPFSLENLRFEEADTTLQTVFEEMLNPYANESSTIRLAKERGVECKNSIRRHNALRYVKLDKGHEVWGTIDNGFYIYDSLTQQTKHFTADDTRAIIESDNISDVLLDRSKTVWMTSAATGLYHILLGDENVHHYRLMTASSFEPTRSVRSFSELPDGSLLVSNLDGDVYRYNLKSGSCNLIRHDENRIYATFTDPEGRTWMGMRNGGVWVDDRHLNSEDNLSAYIIFHIYRTDDGTVWLSTLDKGLVAVHEQTDGHFRFTSYLSNEKVHQVDADAQGRLWIATESGVFMREKGKMRRVYEGCKVVGICCTTDGRVLAATVGSGLLIIKGRELSFVTTAAGLVCDCVSAVAWDDSLGIVAATTAGITVIAPNGKTRIIHSPEGMLADTYNESAALRLSDGRIILGCQDGFVELTRKTDTCYSNESPCPLITSIVINDVVHYQQQFDNVILKHNQNNVCVTFSSLDYKNQPSIIYSYQLEGFDEDWRPSTNETMAIYNNLSPGKYHFRIRAATAGQEWGQETVLEIRIRQPWWRTWWAYLSYLLVIVLFVWHEWRQHNERQRLHRKLEHHLTALYTPKVENENETEKEKEKENENQEHEPKANDRSFLDKLDSVILSNMMQENLDLAFIAEKMCMSHSTLYRRIKSLTGMTANEYVRKHRLTKAMQLLRDGQNVTEVSIQCGFNSSSYFSRCFKAEYGILPSEV